MASWTIGLFFKQFEKESSSPSKKDEERKNAIAADLRLFIYARKNFRRLAARDGSTQPQSSSHHMTLLLPHIAVTCHFATLLVPSSIRSNVRRSTYPSVVAIPARSSAFSRFPLSQNSLKSSQKEKVKQFIAFTNVRLGYSLVLAFLYLGLCRRSPELPTTSNPSYHYSEKIAIKKLKDYNWNTEQALDSFFNDPTGGSPISPSMTQAGGFDQRKLQILFDKYKGLLLTRVCGRTTVWLTVGNTIVRDTFFLFCVYNRR